MHGEKVWGKIRDSERAKWTLRKSKPQADENSNVNRRNLWVVCCTCVRLSFREKLHEKRRDIRSGAHVA
jgi:hypothetical protein